MTHKESRGVTVQQHLHPTENWLSVTLDCHAIVAVGKTIRRHAGCQLIPGVIAELTALKGVQEARELKPERKPFAPMTISFGARYSALPADELGKVMDELLEVVTDLMPSNSSVQESEKVAATASP